MLEDMRTLEGIDTFNHCFFIIIVIILLEDMRTLEGIDTFYHLCPIKLLAKLEDMRTLEGIDTAETLFVIIVY